MRASSHYSKNMQSCGPTHLLFENLDQGQCYLATMKSQHSYVRTDKCKLKDVTVLPV